MDLKWLLMRRIALVALACFAVGTTFAIYRTAHQAAQQNNQLADLVSRQLQLQLSRIDRSTDIPMRFPDWDIIANLALQPGQCIEYRDINGETKRASCTGVSLASARAPSWFVDTYRFLVNGGLSATRGISYRGTTYGTVVARFDAAATAGRAWTTIAPLLGFAAALVAALCLMTYLVINRALRPSQEILAGLDRLARGDLTSRLPPFRLAEFNRMSEVFNALSGDLRKATAERTELARRLVDAQEQERRHIARELHDEIAQKLSALNAQAAYLRTRAQREAPDISKEARELESMASGLMLTLRRTLTYLRPQEIDDLGLIQSLEALIAQHNEGAAGRTEYTIETSGAMEHLRPETSAHVYRIIQEALTNASKHADARNVRVVLTRSAEGDQETIRLSVRDDGVGPSSAVENTAPSPKSGLIGMRERVIALSGKIAAGPAPDGGFGLQVEFPTIQRGA